MVVTSLLALTIGLFLLVLVNLLYLNFEVGVLLQQGTQFTVLRFQALVSSGNSRLGTNNGLVNKIQGENGLHSKFLSWLLAFGIGCHPNLVSGFLVFPCSLWHYYIKKTFNPVVLLVQ